MSTANANMFTAKKALHAALYSFMGPVLTEQSAHLGKELGWFLLGGADLSG